jgi:hypothetical protein
MIKQMSISFTDNVSTFYNNDEKGEKRQERKVIEIDHGNESWETRDELETPGTKSLAHGYRGYGAFPEKYLEPSQMVHIAVGRSGFCHAVAGSRFPGLVG